MISAGVSVYFWRFVVLPGIYCCREGKDPERSVWTNLKGNAIVYQFSIDDFCTEMVYEYLCSANIFVSLTDIVRRFYAENPSYLIQSWLRSRNTVAFLGEWGETITMNSTKMRLKKLLVQIRNPSYTLTPKSGSKPWTQLVLPPNMARVAAQWHIRSLRATLKCGMIFCLDMRCLNTLLILAARQMMRNKL